MNRVTEKAIVAAILRYLKGLPGCHARKVWGGYAPGEPDILACYQGRMLQIECKAPGNGPTPIQEKAMRQWREAGAVAGVARSVEDVKAMMAAAGL